MTSSQIDRSHGTVVPLPTAEQVRADVQRMVDFGPRLTGYPGHDEFCTWVEDETRAAGLENNRAALYRGDPTLGQDGGAEEDREYRDPSATV